MKSGLWKTALALTLFVALLSPSYAEVVMAPTFESYSGGGGGYGQPGQTTGIGIGESFFPIVGNCSPCYAQVSFSMTVSGPPAGDSLWTVTLPGTFSDNFGDTVTLALNASNGSGPQILSETALIALSGVPTAFTFTAPGTVFNAGGGPASTLDYTFTTSISLPTGESFAPLPGSLPLMMTGLAAIGLLGWRQKRKGNRQSLTLWQFQLASQKPA